MPNNLSVDSFLSAIAGDFVNEVKSAIVRDPGLLDIKYSGGTIGWKNPLQTACEHGSYHVATEILRQKPELAKMKNEDGIVPMHLASEKNDLPMVELLKTYYSEAVLVEGLDSMIPLHLAVSHGCFEVIKVLIKTCPHSVLKKTANQETVFHLALKNNQLRGFNLLLREIKKLNHLPELLNARNGDGNTILHIATSKKLVQTVKLLLDLGMEVCTQNYKGLTALDICLENSADRDYMNIRKILTDSKRKGFFEGFSLVTLSANAVFAFVALIMVTCITVVCNMPEQILKHVDLPSEVVPVMDLISKKLPILFYILPFVSTQVMICTFVFSTICWPTPQIGELLRYAWACLCSTFFLIMKGLIPKVSVRVSSTKAIPSIVFVWLIGPATIFLLCLIFSQLVIPFVRKNWKFMRLIIDWVWKFMRLIIDWVSI